ncbi:MAG: hypothetical protein JW956_07560 [Calditrichaceae bacterium]|nr:hypothetical protein [Calditrichaceae bacterium]
MPSLSPGTAGAKEVYGISVIRDDLSITIPPKAFTRYELTPDSFVLLITGRRGEPGFGLQNKKHSEKSVFAKHINQMDALNKIYLFQKKAWVLTRLKDSKLFLSDAMMKAFHLEIGIKLMVVKSTTITMSYSPIEMWKSKLAQHGFYEAIKNIDSLEEF